MKWVAVGQHAVFCFELRQRLVEKSKIFVNDLAASSQMTTAAQAACWNRVPRNSLPNVILMILFASDW